MKLLTRDIPPRTVWALEQAGVHPLLSRLFAARGILSADDLDTSLARLLPPDTLKHTDLAAKLLADAIASPAFSARFASAQPIEEPVGWNLPVGSKRRTIYGDGFLLLGDAASLIDPFTGEGIGNAFYSARTAVETTLAARQANDYSAAFLRRYEDVLWKTLGSELKLSTQLHHLVRNRGLTNFLVRKAARSEYMSDLICGMMANAVPRKHLINPLFYLKLLFK